MKHPSVKQLFKTSGAGEETPGRQRFRGRIYFSRKAEQTLFFYLTAAMLVIGLIYRLF